MIEGNGRLNKGMVASLATGVGLTIAGSGLMKNKEVEKVSDLNDLLSIGSLVIALFGIALSLYSVRRLENPRQPKSKNKISLFKRSK